MFKNKIFSNNLFKKSNLGLFGNRNISAFRTSNKSFVNKSLFPNTIRRFFCEKPNQKFQYSLAKMRKQLREYGPLGLYTYLVLYVLSMGTIYTLIKNKKINPEWVLNSLKTLGVEQYFDTKRLKEILNSEYSTIAFTIIVNRMTLIIRLPITLWLTICMKRLMRKGK